MSAHEPQPSFPTDSPSRIHSLDLLRGFSLLGMFLVHFHARSSELNGLDEAIRTLVWRLVEGKSHGTFALLFGAGFALQLRRAEERHEPFLPRYLRRLAVLACFGFAAHAFFGYNVLLGYAAWGVALLFVRRWSTRALLAAAVLAAASVPLYHLAATSYLELSKDADAVAAAAEARRVAAAEVVAALDSAEAQNSYLVLLAARLRHMAWFYTQPFFFMPNVTLALFLAGLVFVRLRVFERVRANRGLLVVLAIFGLISWLGDNWLLARWDLDSFGILRDQWLTFTYIAGALLVFARWGGLMFPLRPVANAGRMALTNYLLQIAALDVLFSGYAIGLGRVRPGIGVAAAFTCFAAEAAFSTWWLARFRLGPAEWVWRTLTYGRVQPMRRPAAADPNTVRGAEGVVAAARLQS